MAEIIENFNAWLMAHQTDFDGVVLDVDGVLMAGRDALPGSRELLRWLRETQTPFVLLTNDGCNSPLEKAESLSDCGLHFALDEIVSASHGLAELTAQRAWHGRTFYLMGNLGLPCYAEQAGLRVVRDPDQVEECVGVIVGEKHYDWEAAVTAAFNFLITHPAAPLIVPNPDEYFPGEFGRLCPASGAVGRFLQQLCATYGHETTPLYLGKPYEPIFMHAHHRLERRVGRRIERARVLMMGDSLAADIRGGCDFGYRTALALTGITSVPMLSASNVRPDLMYTSLQAD